jgi:hypothetical protein
MDQPIRFTNAIASVIIFINRSVFSRDSFLTLLTLVWFALSSSAQAEPLNRIQKENRQPGTTAWQLTNPADDRQIEGYASLTSVPVGGNISLFVNTADATYSLTVYRMGWYGGKGGRRMLGPQILTGVQQVTPTADPITGLIECHWTNPFTIHVPSSWTSGVYLVKLHGDTSGKESYIIFTVRDSRAAELVFQQSVTTYQAYNPWPGWDSVEGYVGESLYFWQNKDSLQATQVSFDRPYGRGPQATTLNGVGAGEFLTLASGSIHEGTGGVAWEYEMLRWLERQGYDVTYITDVDTHEDVGLLLQRKGFLSVGHDEYWSEEMRSNAIQALSQGVSLGFFSANHVYWPITLLPNSSGFPNRTISAPKDTICNGSDCGTFAFRCNGHPCDPNAGEDPHVSGETEQLLTGAMSLGHFGWNDDIVVTGDALLSHWAFANSGLEVGDVIPGLIGVEFNFVDEEFPKPSGLQILLKRQQMGTEWDMTIYQASSGAWVFNAATFQWSWGLDDYFTGLQTPDGANNGPAIRTRCGEHPELVSCRNSAIEQITRNVLSSFISGQ